MAKTTDNTARFIAASRKAIARGITDAAQVVSKRMKNGFTKTIRFTTSLPGEPPGTQRSRLANSIGFTQAKETAGRFTASAGTNVVYGRIHELGGTIRPKKGRFIPVPINTAAKRLRETHQGSLRSLPMKLVRTKAGKLMLMGDNKVKYRNKEAMLRVNNRPVFVLVKSVRMPKRPWAAPALARATKDGSINRAIKQAVQRGMINFAAGVTP